MHNRFLFIILFVFSSVFMLFPQADSDTSADPESILTNAEELFRIAIDTSEENPDAANELFSQSAVLYKSLIQSGVANGAVYYNTGNAYYRAGHLGRAVLNYRRALLFTPDDSLVLANLDYMRSIQKNSFPQDVQDSISEILLFWHNGISIWWKVLVLVLTNLVFWSSLIARRFIRIPSWISVSALLFLLLFSGSLIIEWSELQMKHAVVTEKSTIGRKGDSHSYVRAFDAPLYEGFELEILQQRVGWLQVRLPNGNECWVDARDCDIVEDLGVD